MAEDNSFHKNKLFANIKKHLIVTILWHEASQLEQGSQRNRHYYVARSISTFCYIDTSITLHTYFGLCCKSIYNYTLT
jgi:hypothetical protein